jgi:hypothetical protein
MGLVDQHGEIGTLESTGRLATLMRKAQRSFALR